MAKWWRKSHSSFQWFISRHFKTTHWNWLLVLSAVPPGCPHSSSKISKGWLAGGETLVSCQFTTRQLLLPLIQERTESCRLKGRCPHIQGVGVSRPSCANQCRWGGCALVASADCQLEQVRRMHDSHPGNSELTGMGRELGSSRAGSAVHSSVTFHALSFWLFLHCSPLLGTPCFRTIRAVPVELNLYITCLSSFSTSGLFLALGE